MNCCENDAPSVSALITVIRTLLKLPLSLTTPAQRSEWQHFLDTLVRSLSVHARCPASLSPYPQAPLLALNPGGSTIAKAEVLSTGTHNSEGPELYPIHPHRLFTVGQQVFHLSLHPRPYSLLTCTDKIMFVHVAGRKWYKHLSWREYGRSLLR